MFSVCILVCGGRNINFSGVYFYEWNIFARSENVMIYREPRVVMGDSYEWIWRGVKLERMWTV